MVGRLSLQSVAGERFEAATRRSHESLLDSPDSGLPPSPSHPLYPTAGPPPRAADGGPSAPGARESPLYAPDAAGRLLQQQQLQEHRLQNVHGRHDLQRGDPASPPDARLHPLPLCASLVDGFGDLAMETASVVAPPPRRPAPGFLGGGPSPPLWGPPRPGVRGARVAREQGVGESCVTQTPQPRLGRLLPYVTLRGGFRGHGGSGGPRLVPGDYSESVCVQAGPRTTSTRCRSEVRFTCGRRYRDGVECEPTLAVASCRQTVVARPSTTRRSFTSELRLEPRQRARRHTATAFAFPRHACRLFRATVTSGCGGGVVAASPSGAATQGAGARYTSCVRLHSLAPPSVGIVYQEDGHAST